MSPEERNRFRDGFLRWKNMSREERREFRKGFGGCGPGMHAMQGFPPEELHEPKET
jgi:hypothetical protein